MQVEGRTTIDEQEGKVLVEPAASGDFRISEERLSKQLLRTLAEQGILEESEPSSYRFAHLTFQEYLAAYALTQTRESIETLLKYVNQASWQEVILLFGRILERQGREKFENLIRSFVTHPDAKGRVAILAGRLLQEVGPKPMSSASQQAVAKKLIQLFSSSMSTSVKVEAGSVLGHIGDPRLVGKMMEVPSGSFIMGGNTQPNDTHPAHEIYLPDFRIGLYPETNAEFANFVETGGYDNAGYWSASGWEYRQRKKWIYPEYWQNNPWNQPNYPIVGVSFFEAVAYCRWLTEKLHDQELLRPDQALSLPTEAMWEKAARGQDARLWPWGDHFHPEYANTAENDIGSTSAVGIFPEGASSYGVLDMCGNVLEWCSSIYSAYPYNAEDGREDLESAKKRVLRGGSWASQRSQSTAIYRHTSPPETRQNIIGFRIVEISNLSE